MAFADGLVARQTLNPARLSPAIVLLMLGIALPAFAALPPEPRPPSVTVAHAEFAPIAETVGLTGTLVPCEEVLVSPQIDNFAVTEIHAEEGDTVQAGQVLARLSRDQLDAMLAQNTANLARAEASIQQAQAAIAEMEANRMQAELAYNRTRDLVSGGNASRESLEQRQAAAQMAAARLQASTNAQRAAQADVALANAQRRELMVRLDRTEIRAPVAGVISRRTARLGAIAAQSADPLFRLIQDGAIEVEADVPETLLARLRPGQSATVDTVNGTRAGRVRLVSPEVNRGTRLGRVRVAITDPGPLVIGSFARAQVEVARREGVLAPLSAVLFQPGGAVIQVVHDGVVETRPVKIGLRAAGRAEITEGLHAGEDVVAVSGTFIRGGDRVTPVPGS